MSDVDASIPLAVKQPQIDLGAILSQGLQLKQMQQDVQSQNALRQILADPNNIDTKTGLPTTNALVGYMRAFPQQGQKLLGTMAATQEKQAQIDHLHSETQKNETAAHAEALSDAVASYDGELASGNVDPNVAERGLKQSMYDYVQSQPWSADEKAKRWESLGAMKPAQIRQLAQTLSLTSAQRQSEEHFQETFGDRQRHEKVTEQALGTTGGQILHDPTTDTDYVYFPRTQTAKTLNGDPYTPGKAQHVASGQARSAKAMAVQKYLEENPNASAQDIARFSGQFDATQTAGGAPAKAEAAGLSNLVKMRDSVSQAEGNARKEADLAESLLNKGGLPGGPSAFGGWVQGTRTGLFNSPDASSFQTAVESLKNEYVKVLSTQGGMSGGMSSDSARREADAYINPRLSKEQIRANIDVMRRSMQNRTDAIQEAIAKARTSTRQAAGVPTDLPDPEGHPDGTKAKDKAGRVVAVLQGGEWVAP